MMEFIKDFFNEMVLMIKPYYKYIKFFFVIMLFFLSSIFQIIPITIFNIDINNTSNNTRALLMLFSNCMALIILFLLYFKEIKNDFSKFKKNNNLFVIYKRSFYCWIIGLSVMIISTFVIEKLGIGVSQNDANVRALLEASPIIYGMSPLLIAPIIEELVFRLSFKNILKNKWLFILLSGIVFGSIHVVFSLNDLYQLSYLIPYCSLGIAFAYIYYETDNIFLPISFHILHNVLTAITTFLLVGVYIW